MSFERIRERIIKEAEDKASEIVENERQRLSSSLELFKEEETSKFEKLKLDREKLLEYDLKKKIDVVKLESKRKILSEKRILLDAFFKKVEENIVNVSKDQYLLFIKKLIIKDAPKVNAFVFLNMKDLERFKKELEEFLKQEFKGSLKLSKEPADIKGGVIIKSEEFEIDDSIEAIIEEFKENNEIEIAKALFEE
jgi:V/A-type H+-transporting ATPase subunit E